MTIADYKHRLHDLIFTCGINQRYHQRVAWWWGVADKLVKIAVGLVAVAALVAALLGTEWENAARWLAAVAAVVAIILNVVPFGEREKFYDELFRCWSDLRTDAEVQDVKTGIDSLNEIPHHAIERLTELKSKEHALDSKEPAPVRCLLRKCEGDEIESRWGLGIRSHSQAEQERAKRHRTTTSALAAPVSVADRE